MKKMLSVLLSATTLLLLSTTSAEAMAKPKLTKSAVKAKLAKIALPQRIKLEERILERLEKLPKPEKARAILQQQIDKRRERIEKFKDKLRDLHRRRVSVITVEAEVVPVIPEETKVVESEEAIEAETIK